MAPREVPCDVEDLTTIAMQVPQKLADPIGYACPHCGASGAVVRKAQTVAGCPRDIKIELECPHCRRTWALTEDHGDGRLDN